MIAIASDHAGFDLKQIVIEYLNSKGIECKDYGTYEKKSVDYPDYALLVSEAVAKGEHEKGILICGTGVGMSMAANKVKGIRASLCTDTFTARATRQHNDANILCIGERVTGPGLVLDIVDTWLNTPFEGGRHLTRVNKIMAIED